MYRTGNANWQSRIFFVLTGLFFTWAVHYLITGSIDPAYDAYRRSPANRVSANLDSGAEERILLPLNVATTVGPRRFIYKGKRAGCVLIDVLIPALDRDFAYHHVIPREMAKRGFNLAGREFILVAANRTAACIRYLDAD